MRKRMMWLLIFSMGLLLTLSACSINTDSVVTLVPEIDLNLGDDQAKPAVTPTVDQSPRSAIGVELPPTWTPAAQLELNRTPLSADSEAIEASSEGRSYVIQVGDTLGEIAERFNVTVEQLIQANQIEDADHIEVGQVIVIPTSQ